MINDFINNLRVCECCKIKKTPSEFWQTYLNKCIVCYESEQNELYYQEKEEMKFFKKILSDANKKREKRNR